MNDDELQRKMDFIVEHQAQFAADIQQITSKQNLLTEAMNGVVGMVGKLSSNQEQLLTTVDALTVKVDSLAASQKATDERVNVLIDVIEKYFSDRQNGNGNNAGS